MELNQPLKNMFFNQYTLVKEYVDKEKQPNYPVSLLVKENQNFIRDLFGFLEEEIFEAFSNIEDLSIVLRDNKPDFGKPKVREYLSNLTEEVADTWAFWLEIFMYLNMNEDTIFQYYNLLLETLGLERLFEEDTLGMGIKFAEHILQVGYGQNTRTLAQGGFNLVHYNFKENDPERNEIPLAGQVISPMIVTLSQHYLFHSVKHLQIARNCLKMKYWRETEETPNYDKLQANLMESFLNYMVFLYCNGFTNSTQIYKMHQKKTLKNLERIKTGW